MSATEDVPATPILVQAPARPALAGWQRGALVLLGLAAALAPIFVLESFQLFQLTMAVIMALAVLGLNIVTGYNGQISLGHGAFYAVGAYCTAILMSHGDWSFWATLPVSAAVCAALGFAVGFPALRLGGLYLALTTFSLAVAVPQILKHRAIEDWTGGVQGLFLVKPDPPSWLPLERRPMDVRGGAARLRRAVPARLEPHPQPHRPRPDGDARQPDGGGGDGHEHRHAQDPRLRGQRHGHRHRRLARRGGGGVRRAGQLRLRRVHQPLRRHGGGRRGLHPRLGLRRPVRAVRAEHRRGDLQGGARA